MGAGGQAQEGGDNAEAASSGPDAAMCGGARGAGTWGGHWAAWSIGDVRELREGLQRAVPVHRGQAGRAYYLLLYNGGQVTGRKGERLPQTLEKEQVKVGTEDSLGFLCDHFCTGHWMLTLGIQRVQAGVWSRGYHGDKPSLTGTACPWDMQGSRWWSRVHGATEESWDYSAPRNEQQDLLGREWTSCI